MTVATGVLKVCVDEAGSVKSATVLRSLTSTSLNYDSVEPLAAFSLSCALPAELAELDVVFSFSSTSKTGS
jgi:hypothetical protein